MLSKEECFHKWFGSAMPDMQKETTALVNNICVSTTAAYLAGWEECARQNKGSAEQQTDNKPSMPVCPHYSREMVKSSEYVEFDICTCKGNTGKPAHVG